MPGTGSCVIALEALIFRATMSRHDFPPVSLALDTPSQKQVGSAVRSILGGVGPRWIVAAYVTHDELAALNRRPGAPRARLLCDPFQGNCKPDLLVRLSKHAD